MGLSRWKLGFLLLLVQAVFLLLFAIFVRYESSADSKAKPHGHENEIDVYYAQFQDVHVMMFIGFGFLMTFLRRYGFSSVGFNMVLAALVIQWNILIVGFLHIKDEKNEGKIIIDITHMLGGDFAAATILISFGALLGKTSPLQLCVMAIIEVVIFTCNEYIGLHLLHAIDIGGSMFVHTFGAYYALSISRVLYRKDVEESEKEGSRYNSDIFAMIGTIFLWLYWPSFNSALGLGDDRHRAVINTYLALVACTLTAFAVSSLVNKEAKLDMVHIQNSTLAGGVAVGTSSDMMIGPWGAMTIGMVAGLLSVIGYKFITPFIARRLKIHDTCGVNNLHGMPGILAGIAGAVAAAVANEDSYGNSLYQTFPERSPMNNTAEYMALHAVRPDIEPGHGRSGLTQAGYQLLALGITLAVAIGTGIITGFVLKLPFLAPPKGDELFEDETWWETPPDFEQHHEAPPSAKRLLHSDGHDMEAKV